MPMNPQGSRCISNRLQLYLWPSQTYALRPARLRPRRCTSAAICQPNVSLSAMLATTVRTRLAEGGRRLLLRRFWRCCRLAAPQRGPVLLFHIGRQPRHPRPIQEFAGRLRLWIGRLFTRTEAQATRHLRLPPARLVHPTARFFYTGLHASAIEHHGRRGWCGRIRALQTLVTKGLDFFVLRLPPLTADAFA